MDTVPPPHSGQILSHHCNYAHYNSRSAACWLLLFRWRHTKTGKYYFGSWREDTLGPLVQLSMAASWLVQQFWFWITILTRGSESVWKIFHIKQTHNRREILKKLGILLENVLKNYSLHRIEASKICCRLYFFKLFGSKIWFKWSWSSQESNYMF